MHTKKKTSPLILCILDGWGIGDGSDRDAIASAPANNFFTLMETFGYGTLFTHGEYVGLPNGTMGNSEVGHQNLGAGRIVKQQLVRINDAIKDGSINTNKYIVEIIKKLKERNSYLHLIGLVSDGGVHSHINHLFALINIFENSGIKSWIHIITDGRDTGPKDGIKFIKSLMTYLNDKSYTKIATISGRYYTMDRDKRWDRTKLGFDLIVHADAENRTNDIISYLNQSYKRGIGDEFIKPCIVDNGYKGFQRGDIFLMFNFRADRMRQLTRALSQKDFEEFERGNFCSTDEVYCMTNYEKDLNLPVLFSDIFFNNILGEYLSKLGLKQFRTAETEKYAHVTYFFNCRREKPFKYEDRLLIPSPKISTYDLKPEMSAYRVTEEFLDRLKKMTYDFMLINFANPDMVGHTGVLNAARKAVKTVDICLSKIVKEAIGKYNIIITADHGNCEYMYYDDKSPHTAHTTNKVPIIAIDIDKKGRIREKTGALCDVAPTALTLMGIDVPDEMDGDILI